MTTAVKVQPWAMPDARAILPYDAPKATWLEARKAGIGGSEIGVLLGVSRWRQSPHGLWLIKSGRSSDERSTAYMERGSDIEPIILRKFSKDTGIAIRRQGMVASRRNPHMLFNADALAADGSIVEAKLVSQYARPDWIDEVTGERRPPLDYEWQVRHGCAVMGRAQGYVAALDADSWELDIYVIEAGAGDFQVCDEATRDFWRHVEADEPPPIDYATASAEEMLARFREMVDPGAIAEAALPEAALADLARLKEIRAMGSAYRRREKEEKEIKTRITMQIGDKEFLGVPDGRGGLRPVAHWKSVAETKFRQKDLEAEQPEIFERYVNRGRTRRLELVAGEAA